MLSRTLPRSGRRASRILLILAAVAGLFAVAAPAQALTTATITSAGPLDEIFLTDELNCQVAHVDDASYEFYSPSDTVGACTTQIHVAGTTYGPSAIPAGNAPTPFTPVSQSGVLGSGTEADPYRVETVVDVGDTGLRITQADSYVEGLESYRSDVVVSNTSTADADVVVYRAGDCYLQESDFGFGAVDTASGAVSCVAADDSGSVPGDRIEQWYPLTEGSTYYEAEYFQVWDLVAAGSVFPDTCRCDEHIDNGAGLSWALTVPAGASITVSHLTLFSPLGVEPVAMTKSAASDTTEAGGSNSYTITLDNPNDTAVTVDTIVDDLPEGFGYVGGTSSGLTTTDPAVSGTTLTWSGSFEIPAEGSASLSFDATVSDVAGTYFNQASGSAAGVTVVGTGETAPVTVTDNGGNVAPTVDAGSGSGAPEGSPITLEGTVDDADGDVATTTWSITPGGDVDAGATCQFADASSTATTVTCTDDGSYTATLTADDGTNPPTSDDVAVTVTNAAPAVSIDSVTSSGDVGDVVELSATFDDAGANDSHTCSIDWGDGTVDTPDVSAGTCTGSHDYAEQATYTVTVSVTDDDGATGSDQVTVTVGDGDRKLNGGGYVEDEGRISFGFIVQDDGGLQGELQVRQDGRDGHRFHGDVVDSLHVDGSEATWTGTGAWDGASGYRYEVSVVDSRHGGSGQRSPHADEIRIVVTEGDGDVVLDVSGPLQGGDITVHGSS